MQALDPPCEVMKIAISPAAQIFAHHVAPGCESFAHTAGHEQINSTGSWNRAHELSKDLTSFIQPETPVKRALGSTSIEPQRRRSHESQRYKSRASASYGRFLACFTLLRPKPPAGGANELDVSPRSMVNMPGDAMAYEWWSVGLGMEVVPRWHIERVGDVARTMCVDHRQDNGSDQAKKR